MSRHTSDHLSLPRSIGCVKEDSDESAVSSWLHCMMYCWCLQSLSGWRQLPRAAAQSVGLLCWESAVTEWQARSRIIYCQLHWPNIAHDRYVQSDHWSRKPENVREFYSCRGNVRAITKNQRNVRGESEFCHENCLLLTSGLWLNQCLMGYCRLCFKGFYLHFESVEHLCSGLLCIVSMVRNNACTAWVVVRWKARGNISDCRVVTKHVTVCILRSVSSFIRSHCWSQVQYLSSGKSFLSQLLHVFLSSAELLLIFL